MINYKRREDKVMKNNHRIMSLIVILIIIILCLGGYIIYDKVLRENRTPDIILENNNQEETDLNKVTAELEELIDVLNGNADKCDFNILALDAADIYFNETNNINFWNEFGPVVMACMYNEEYTKVTTPLVVYYLMDKEQYQNYGEFFSNKNTLIPFNNVDVDGYKEEYSDYYLAYSYGSGSGTSKVTFSLEEIVQNGEFYDIKVKAIDTDYFGNEVTYEGIFKVEEIDNRLKYYELLFKEI